MPRTWPVRASDLAAIALGNGLLIVGMWARHGNLAELDTLGGILTAGGQWRPSSARTSSCSSSC